LYGAGSDPILDKNSIYARWLQQRVIFQIQSVPAVPDLGNSGVTAYGPDVLHIDMVSGQNVETGRFRVLSEGNFISSPATVLVGDIWENRLNVVDMDDLKQFCAQWLMTGNSFDADFNRNNVVDFADFAIFSNSWLDVCPPDWPL
jgi:hypothetical protein